MEKFTPQHPLPDEIQAMKKDDTVCQFCGVSYLIHSEIKALEDKLARTEKELAHLKGSEEREKKLKQELQTSDAEKVLLKTQLEERDTTLTLAQSSLLNLESQCRKLNEENDLFKEKVIKDEEDIQKLNQEKKTLMSVLSSLQTQIKSYRIEHDDMKSIISDSLNSFSMDVQRKSMSLMSVIKMAHMDIVSSRARLDSELNENSNLMERVREYEISQESSLHTNQQLTETLKLKDQLNETLRDLRVELTETQSNVAQLEKETLDKSRQLLKRAEEIENLTQEFDSRQKTFDSRNNSLQSELSKLKSEVGGLRSRCAQLENDLEMYREKIGRTDKNAASIQDEKERKEAQLERAVSDLEAMKLEREQMINAHQNRIEDLRESFRNKMREADKWPDKMNKALADSEAKHQKEIENLDANIRGACKSELLIQKEKYEEMVSRLTDEHKQTISTLKNKLHAASSNQAEIESLQRQIKNLKADAQGTEARLRSEIESLKNIINQLETKLDKLDLGADELVVKLKQELFDREGKIKTQTEENRGKDKEIAELREQIRLLQKTVSQECEERMELMDSLSEAREQLLLLKKPPGGFGMRNGSPKLTPITSQSPSSQTPRVSEEIMLYKRSAKSTTPSPSIHTSRGQNNHNNAENTSNWKQDTLTSSRISEPPTSYRKSDTPTDLKPVQTNRKPNIESPSSLQNFNYPGEAKPSPLQGLRQMDQMQKKRLAAIMSRNKS